MTYVWATVAVFAVGVLFFAFQGGQSKTKTVGQGYVVGDPGPGKKAPALNLQATNGKTVDLADYQGKRVMLYFQEGIGCQPCWDQIRDLEKDPAKLKAAGVDEVLSVTTSPLALITQKVKDESLTTPVASDPTLTVSKDYGANQYGMMGDTRDGHSFVLVGADGKIVWRADYGGAPDYTMYVPVDKILADLAQGTGKA